MDLDAVKVSYARWAPIYDRSFGAVTNRGRRQVVRYISQNPGRVLEVGVGTGLALPHYSPEMEVIGIDFSEEMLAKASAKVERFGLTHVKALQQMDARELAFPDDHFDTVTAMHVLSVVPQPERVMAEMVRVCKPGGQVVISNHFARDKGVLAVLERLAVPLEKLLGWHSDFPIDAVMQEAALQLIEKKPLPPFGMMTFLAFRKAALA